MAKTVKIPDNMRPWKCTINGVEYVYPAGTTQEVPDEVAALIEQCSKVEPEKEPAKAPFGGSWNDLTDKPFGETTGYGDTLTWDGNTEGLESNDTLGEQPFYLVSSATPTYEDFAGGFSLAGMEFTQESVTDIGGGFLTVAETLFVVPCDNFELTDEYGTISVAKKGIYNNPEALSAFSLTIPGYNGFMGTTIKRMDEKYMPLLTDEMGGKWKLVVEPDGTLRAEQVAG